MELILHGIHQQAHTYRRFMITNKEKADILLNKINNIDSMIESFIKNVESCEGKYVLEDEIAICNIKKEALLAELASLGNP